MKLETILLIAVIIMTATFAFLPTERSSAIRISKQKEKPQKEEPEENIFDTLEEDEFQYPYNTLLKTTLHPGADQGNEISEQFMTEVTPSENIFENSDIPLKIQKLPNALQAAKKFAKLLHNAKKKGMSSEQLLKLMEVEISKHSRIYHDQKIRQSEYNMVEKIILELLPDNFFENRKGKNEK